MASEPAPHPPRKTLGPHVLSPLPVIRAAALTSFRYTVKVELEL